MNDILYFYFMEFEFSKHALQRMESRTISKEIVTTVINNPDSVLVRKESILVYSKLVQESSKPYLYRVFLNKSKNPALIITVYKTSKIEKYGY